VYVNIRTAKGHTSGTPPGDYNYSRVKPLLLLQVIIFTAKRHTFVTPSADYTYSKEE
jgi:hypothetical protein